MATMDVKIPPQWLRTPDYRTRGDLLESRKQECYALGVAIEGPVSCRKQFARSEKIYRDTHHRSGVFERSPRQQQLDPPPQDWHPRATCSGSPTKAILLAKRQQEKRLESLKFEPHEIERLRDIPKADQLANWWKRPAPGYIQDPTNSASFRDSLRLELANRGRELGPVDPAKIRSPASVNERRFLREKRSQLADKVTHVAHLVPDDYPRDGASISTPRAPDLHPQEQRAMGIRSVGRLSSEPWSLPVSPIKVSPKRKAPRKAIENLILESTSQRILLDQFKGSQLLAARPLSANRNSNEGDVGGALLSPIAPSSESAHGRSVFRDPIRCGGFS